MPTVECIPNFSEGRNTDTITQIAEAIRSVSKVKLLHQDIGADVNRTVMTFAGQPEAVAEAAFRAIKVAQERIDMRKQTGTHPRIGATDVCPIVPLEGITMEETVNLARNLARRVGEELDYPVYCYEEAAFQEERRNLAFIRKGNYEGLTARMEAGFLPDFGPHTPRPRTGASVISARELMLAVNFNLDTKDVRAAKSIAKAVRASGGGRHPGAKAIGWFIEEYEFAQVSMNLTRLQQTGLFAAYQAVSEEAKKRGFRITGTEIIGLAPLSVFKETALQLSHTALPESEQLLYAIEYYGLNQLSAFIPKERILEYALEERKQGSFR